MSTKSLILLIFPSSILRFWGCLRAFSSRICTVPIYTQTANMSFGVSNMTNNDLTNVPIVELLREAFSRMGFSMEIDADGGEEFLIFERLEEDNETRFTITHEIYTPPTNTTFELSEKFPSIKEA